MTGQGHKKSSFNQHSVKFLDQVIDEKQGPI